MCIIWNFVVLLIDVNKGVEFLVFLIDYGGYINNNGIILPDSSPTIMPKIVYMYGDGVFETIRIMNGKPINLRTMFKASERSRCFRNKDQSLQRIFRGADK